jgi:hypothetical protein
MVKLATVAMGIVAVVAMSAPTADAALALRVAENGGAFTTITDGGLGDSSVVAGVINYAAPAGLWTVNVDVGSTSPPLAPPPPHMDLSFIAISNAASTSLDIQFTENGFSAAFPSFLNLQNGFTVGAGMMLTYSVYQDTSNAMFGMGGGPIFTCSQIGAVGNCGPGILSAPIAVSGAYSVTQAIHLTNTLPGSVASGDAELQIPEPSVLALFGLGMLGIGATVRRRRSN